MSDAELASLIEDAHKALRGRQDGRRKETLAKIKELAASIGVNAEISDPSSPSKPGGRKGTKVPAKYQNPNNLSQKWTGRGMKPKWLQSLLEQGRDIKEFEIGT
ncbi:MAG: H-NS histone family protein [Methylomagnum sp.]